MASSDTVVDAFLSMCETDYRGAVRSLVTAGNPQMSEEEIRERVRLQTEYQPQETAVARLRAWVEDDSLEAARASGEKLWLLCADNTGGGWFPAGREAAELSRQLFPEAHVEEIEDGIMSRPDLTASIVRRVTAPLRATTRLSRWPDSSVPTESSSTGRSGARARWWCWLPTAGDIPAFTKPCSRTSPAITAS